MQVFFFFSSSLSLESLRFSILWQMICTIFFLIVIIYHERDVSILTNFHYETENIFNLNILSYFITVRMFKNTSFLIKILIYDDRTRRVIEFAY